MYLQLQRQKAERFHLQCFPYQLSDEDTLKSVACKKMVTFDLSSSEDTNSISSVNIHLPKCKFLTGLILRARCFWQCLAFHFASQLCLRLFLFVLI